MEFKPTFRKPLSKGSKELDKSFSAIDLTEIDSVLTEKEHSFKKKFWDLSKMESLVFSDPILSAEYEDMSEDGQEKYGYHYNETIMNMLFNKYVTNDQGYQQKYLNAIPTKKERRDKSGINQLQQKGEEKMQQKGITPKTESDVPIHNNSLEGVIEEDGMNNNLNSNGGGTFDDREYLNQRINKKYDTTPNTMESNKIDEIDKMVTPNNDPNKYTNTLGQNLQNHLNKGFTKDAHNQFSNSEMSASQANKEALNDPNPLSLDIEETNKASWAGVANQHKNFSNTNTSVQQANKDAMNDPDPLNIDDYDRNNRAQDDYDVMDIDVKDSYKENPFESEIKETTGAVSSGAFSPKLGEKHNVYEGKEAEEKRSKLYNDALKKFGFSDITYDSELSDEQRKKVSNYIKSNMSESNNISKSDDCDCDDCNDCEEQIDETTSTGSGTGAYVGPFGKKGKNHVTNKPAWKGGEIIGESYLINSNFFKKIYNDLNLNEGFNSPNDYSRVPMAEYDITNDKESMEFNLKQAYQQMSTLMKKSDPASKAAYENIKKTAQNISQKLGKQFKEPKQGGFFNKVKSAIGMGEGEVNEDGFGDDIKNSMSNTLSGIQSKEEKIKHIIEKGKNKFGDSEMLNHLNDSDIDRILQQVDKDQLAINPMGEAELNKPELNSPDLNESIGSLKKLGDFAKKYNITPTGNNGKFSLNDFTPILTNPIDKDDQYDLAMYFANRSLGMMDWDDLGDINSLWTAVENNSGDMKLFVADVKELANERLSDIDPEFGNMFGEGEVNEDYYDQNGKRIKIIPSERHPIDTPMDTQYNTTSTSYTPSKVPTDMGEGEEVNEKAKSKSQQQFMGMVHAAQKGELDNPSASVEKVANTMKPDDVEDFASTKHKGLPQKVTEAGGRKYVSFGEATKLADALDNMSVEDEAKYLSNFAKTKELSIPEFKYHIQEIIKNKLQGSNSPAYLKMEYIITILNDMIDQEYSNTDDMISRVKQDREQDRQISQSDSGKKSKMQKAGEDVWADFDPMMFSMGESEGDSLETSDENIGYHIAELLKKLYPNQYDNIEDFKMFADLTVKTFFDGNYNKAFSEIKRKMSELLSNNEGIISGTEDSIISDNATSISNTMKDVQGSIPDMGGEVFENTGDYDLNSHGRKDDVVFNSKNSMKDVGSSHGGLTGFNNKTDGYYPEYKKPEKQGAPQNKDLGKYDSMTVTESNENNLNAAKEEAKRISKEEGVAQHVNKFSDNNYKVSDWYDSETTVASFENGNTINENNQLDEEGQCRRDEKPVAGKISGEEGACEKKNKKSKSQKANDNKYNVKFRNKKEKERENKIEKKHTDYQKELEQNRKHMKKLKEMVENTETISEDKKHPSMVNLDRINKDNAKNFKTDIKNSNSAEIAADQDELTAQEQYEDVPENAYELAEKIEKEKMKEHKFNSFENDGNSTNDDNKSIPKRNATDDEAEDIMLNRGTGMQDIAYDNKPDERFEKRMEKDMGDTIYNQRKEKMEFRAGAPMYNKDKQPITADGAPNKYDKNVKENHIVAGKFVNDLNKTIFVNFNVNEAPVKLVPEGTKLIVEGMGNTYTQGVNENVEMRNMMDSFDFYINGGKVSKVPKGKQTLTEGEEKKPINEQLEKMKKLWNYKPEGHLSTSNVKKNRGF